MVNVTHRPLKEIIIMDYTAYEKPESLATILSLSISSGQPAILSWAEGIVFIPAPIPIDTEKVAAEYLEGRIYWTTVAFAPMATFQPSIKVSGVEIPIIDTSRNHIIRDVARWLKERQSNSSSET